MVNHCSSRPGTSAERLFLFFLAMLASVSLSCSDSVEPEPISLSLALLSADFETGTVGDTLPDPIEIAYVVDGTGEQRGGRFEIEIVSGNGTVSWEGSDRRMSSSGNGIVMSFFEPTAPAQVAWQLGTTAGLNALRIKTAEPNAPDSTISVFAVGVAGPVAIVTKSADGQIGTPDQALPAAIGLRVADHFDNPVSGVDVTWAVTSGGGSLNGSEATTDEAGLVTRGWTLGSTLGEQTVTATVGSVGTFRFTAWAENTTNVQRQSTTYDRN